MALENIQIEYRPLCIGFCVRHGNVQDTVTAAKLNTFLWGGAYNPIIPVGAPDGLADELINNFQVDILLPVEEVAELKEFTKQYEWARFPMMHHSDTIVVEDSFKRGYKKSSVLDVSHLLSRLWEKEFKFAPDGTSNCALVTWAAKDPSAVLLNMLFGAYPKPRDKFAYNYKENYKKGLRAKEVKLDQAKAIPARVAQNITPIGLIQQGIKTWGGRRYGAGIYVGDSKNFVDLVNFWNIRATGVYVTFYPEKNSRRYLSYVRSHVSKIKNGGNAFGDNKASISVWYRSETNGDLEKIRKAIKPLERKGRRFLFSGISAYSWSGYDNSPRSHSIEEVSCIANVGEKYGKPAISISLAGKPTRKRERRIRDQYFVVALKQSSRTEFPEHTLAPPVLPDLNGWYSEKMAFDRHSVRVSKSLFGSSVGVITDIDADSVDLNPIPNNDLLEKIFERASITAKRSGAGLLADRLIARMAGVSGSARIFKIAGVRKYIGDHNPLHQQTRYKIEELIRDKGSFDKYVGQFGLRGSPVTTAQVFDVMLEYDLIKAGIEVRCPKCSLKNWIPLDSISEIYDCEYCQERSKLVKAVDPLSIKAETDAGTLDGVRWSYRLSGLLGGGDKQQGAIPVILTLQHLENRMHWGLDAGGIRSTALDLDYEVKGEKRKAETDLVVLDMSQRVGKEDIEMLIGECKTGQQITRAQIDRLVEIKDLIEQSGIKCHLVFTKLKTRFSATEITHFKRLVASGIKPILFTSNELELWWDEYRNFKQERSDFKLPVEHPFTFSELAENSAYVYRLA